MVSLLAAPLLGQSPGPHSDSAFDQAVKPFVAKNCNMCHNERMKSGAVSLEGFDTVSAVHDSRDLWELVARKIRTGEMPPKGIPRPKPEDAEAVIHWIDSEFARLDRSVKPDPGRVTARRLNRAEYNNTIRDLIGVDFRPADDFPADDAGYGFDNIGDVLSLSPILMEKYLAAAEKITRKAIGLETLRPTIERYRAETLIPVAEGLPSALSLQANHIFPADAEYEIRIGFGGRTPAGECARVVIYVDDEEIRQIDVHLAPGSPRLAEARVPLKAGERQVRAAFIFFEDVPPGRAGRDNNVVIDQIEIRGPFLKDARPLPDTYRAIFICGQDEDSRNAACADRIISNFARRAWRRPVTTRETNALLRFFEMSRKDGDTFEQSIQVALKAVLVSPHFLFRIERHPAPGDPDAIHRIGDFELATRLSYFLWSSMPDEELFRLASEKKLSQQPVLEAQVRRMLKDRRAQALVENFAGQWLHLRNLDYVKPDPERFPTFDPELREAMMKETQLFFKALLDEDRSVLDFLDADFTYLNERLAKHYGIPGVQGRHFRRVQLTGEQRGGVLTQASVLTVSSYPTRTSPVMRGKWVLENILGTPPPPPPDDVPTLNEEEVGLTGTLRQQMEQHRANAVCASCHARMDAIGFGLENYDAIGAWRTMDGKFPVDASGVMPNGKEFSSPKELKDILMSEREDFVQCITERMLTYALGRGLERYDRPTIRAIAKNLANHEYRFSRLVLEIVNSMPFQMRRGEIDRRSGVGATGTVASNKHGERR
ncbi:MAG: DUF1592 domain-containing protein [Bryobacteraceae bacterium]